MSRINKKLLAGAVSGALLTMPGIASATNGMNLEGYGPVATGMGGASMAYDNGSAAVMNNPATIGLMDDGASRLDVAVGLLAPDITSSMSAMPVPDAESSGGPYVMPALGWVTRQGNLSYGVGMFAQGGMGTDYAADSFLAAGSGEKVRSEVGVGRLIAPLAFNVNDKLTVGGSAEVVWASMDLMMAMPGGLAGGVPTSMPGNFIDMTAFGGNVLGTVSGSMVNILGGAILGGNIDDVNWVRFDFSNGGDFAGKAKSTGFGAKIGAVYKVNSKLTLGAAYHAKTALGDMETDDAKVSMNIVDDVFTGGNPVTVKVTGDIKVKDFQWPDMIALGGSYKISDKIMLAADYKRINWSNVMKDFKMTFTADASQADPLAAGFGLGGSFVDATMYQDWEDQNVFMIGGSVQVADPVTVRAGLNIANNPVPDEYMNPLFPAIIKNHVTLGLGYQVNKESNVDVSMVYAPEVDQTNSNTTIETTHSQLNWQFMYSQRF